MTDQEIRDSIYCDQWTSVNSITPSKTFKVIKVKDGENLSGGWIPCDCSIVTTFDLKITEAYKSRKQPIVLIEISDGKQIDYAQLISVADIQHYQECDIVRSDFPRRMFCTGSFEVCRVMQCRMKNHILSTVKSTSVKPLVDWDFEELLSHIREDLKWIIKMEHRDSST